MKSSEAISLLNDIYKHSMTVPTKRVRKLTKVIIDDNTMLKKDNERLRKKIRRVKDGKG